MKKRLKSPEEFYIIKANYIDKRLGLTLFRENSYAWQGKMPNTVTSTKKV